MDTARYLLIDVGNTTVKFGLAGRTGDVASYSLPTAALATADYAGLLLLDLLRAAGIPPENIAGALAASVVPRLNPILRGAVTRFCRVPLVFAPEESPIPVENRYERPAEVGADRLVAALAASRLYPAPAQISIDFGTATTFDCVADGAYLGGLICPGILSSAEALAGRTAKLPQADLNVPGDELIFGRSTAESLNQGLVFGFAAMADGLVARLKRLLPQGAAVVATGGYAQAVARFCPAIEHVRPELLLEGLRILCVDHYARAADAGPLAAT